MISVIVPAYQSASYIDVCVRSVLRQTWQDFELILVDDGSTDQTGEICRRLQASDPRVKYLSRPHQGVSAARNAGVRAASGEYLFFLDSDDAIHPKLLEALHRCAEKTGAAILGCDYEHIKSAHFQRYVERTKDSAISEDYMYMENRETLACFFRSEERLQAIGGKLVRKDMAGTIPFDESLPNAEDTKYLYQIIARGADVCILLKHWYYYRQRKRSASQMKTPTAYESMCQAERYIRDMELKIGRMPNVVKREYNLARRMSEWYVACRKAHDREQAAHVKKLAETERTLDIWRELSLGTRAEFLLAFCCPALYPPCDRMLRAIVKLRKSRRGDS